MDGQVFLADEISLADDSVLERLNSLLGRLPTEFFCNFVPVSFLEPERTLLLAEKGIDLKASDNSELIIAHENFFFVGTMNPGGDFGKKELSPALRNRFTEIWCEPCKVRQDLVAIIERTVKTGISFGNQQDGSSGLGNGILDFVEWFENTELGKRFVAFQNKKQLIQNENAAIIFVFRFTISIRDILTWVNFVNSCAEIVDISEAYVHGACLTFLDSLGSGVTGTERYGIVAEENTTAFITHDKCYWCEVGVK